MADNSWECRIRFLKEWHFQKWVICDRWWINFLEVGILKSWLWKQNWNYKVNFVLMGRHWQHYFLWRWHCYILIEKSAMQNCPWLATSLEINIWSMPQQQVISNVIIQINDLMVLRYIKNLPVSCRTSVQMQFVPFPPHHTNETNCDYLYLCVFNFLTLWPVHLLHWNSSVFPYIQHE